MKAASEAKLAQRLKTWLETKHGTLAPVVSSSLAEEASPLGRVFYLLSYGQIPKEFEDGPVATHFDVYDCDSRSVKEDC